ncbi:hypothetical protein [Streptomyces longwoodensis]|uniref:hypothetical protein n=1 Tax=Streptomyces longwoodensis TaxID=68231 RepID=UPI0033DD9D13
MTADEVRAIVREEIREALKVLKDEAERFPSYDSDTLEDAAARVLGQVAESTESVLQHPPTCKIRNGGRYYWDCDCGVKA